MKAFLEKHKVWLGALFGSLLSFWIFCHAIGIGLTRRSFGGAAIVIVLIVGCCFLRRKHKAYIVPIIALAIYMLYFMTDPDKGMLLGIHWPGQSREGVIAAREVAKREALIVRIPPYAYTEAGWDEYGPGYNGSRGWEGTNEVWMRKIGHITYTFRLSQVDPNKDYSITACLSSEFKYPQDISDISKSSEVTLWVNGVKTETINVIPDDEKGRIYEWVIPGQRLRKGTNSISFTVERDAPWKNGIAIKTYPPITIAPGTI